jgi:large repetitive protein
VISRFKTPAYRRWLSPLVALVVILAMAPAALAATAPAAPTGLTATPGDGQVVLNWTAPDNGGSAIINYVVQYKLATASTYITVSDAIPDDTTATVKYLTNGSRYQFRVRAVNAIGSGPWEGVFATPAAAAAVPGAPQNLAGVRGDRKVSLTWAAPASDGGSPITDYVVQYKLSTAATYSTLADGVSTATTATVTYLTNGLLYNFRVRAKNAVGSGPWATISATPAPPTVPGVPQNLAAAAGNEQVTITWAPPASDGESPILDYAMHYRTGGGAWTLVDPAAAGVIVSGLANGTEYEFQVRARNAVGSGSWSASVFATPMTTPGIPLNLAATAPDAGQQVALTWDAPADDGGSAILDYSLHYRTGGGAWTLVDPADAGVIVSGLANGTEYEFQVRARNIVGSSAWSASVFATPMTFPGIPLNLAAAPDDQQATLTWDPPADDGGAAIIDYAISYRISGGSWSAPTPAASGVVVPGLVNGTSYEFRVRARNSVGSGTWSASVSAIPRTIPGAPTGLAPTPGSTQVALTWSAPASNGGAAIDDYIVQYRSGGGAWLTFPDGTSTNLFATVTGLANGLSYEFQVLAHNVAGNGPASTSVFSTPRTAPSTPTAGTATPGNQQVALTWAEPANGGAAIDDYQVQYCIMSNCAATWTLFDEGVSTNLFATVTGLTNGTEYGFRVRAQNAAGWGTWSGPISATPRTTPGAPTGLTPTPGNTQVALTWSAPASNGGAAIDDYVVQYRTGGGGWSTFPDGTSTNLFATVTGLTNGLSYEFQVLAHNVAGNSTPSTSVFSTPATTPGVPQGLNAAAGDAQVVLTFAAPASNGGSAITDYQVQYKESSSGTWLAYSDGAPSAATGRTVTGLTNGVSYDFQVQAVNAMGASPWTATVSATPAAPVTMPGIPQNLAGARGNQQVTLTWDPPADDGGSPILDYAYEWRVAGGSWSSPISPAASGVVVSGLANGTQYEFRVRARNAIGSGSWAAGVLATPATAPGAPTGLAPTPGNTQVALAWSAPGSNGGAVIDDYIVQYRSGGGAWLTFPDGTSTNLFATVTGLTNGTNYEFQVQAVNAVGGGAFSSSVSATPSAATVPGTPRNLAAAQGNGRVTLTWIAPSSDGGSPIIDYAVQWRITGIGAWTPVNPAASGVIVTGLDNGTQYEFQVQARNAIGSGSWSTSVTATPTCSSGCPATPSGLTSTGHTSTYMDLDWNYVSGASGYQVRYCVAASSSGCSTGWVLPYLAASQSQLRVSGLTAGTWYSFQVRAWNATGNSPWSTVYTHQTS